MVDVIGETSGNGAGQLPPIPEAIDAAKRRAALVEFVGQMIALDRNRTAMAGDLDDMKSVNDTQGHDAGNKRIARAHAIMLEHIRPEDEVVLNPTGDEFLLLMHGRFDVTALRERIQAELDAEGIGASLGGRAYRAGESIEGFLDDVDALMRENKLERAGQQVRSIRRRFALWVTRQALRFGRIPERSATKYLGAAALVRTTGQLPVVPRQRRGDDDTGPGRPDGLILRGLVRARRSR